MGLNFTPFISYHEINVDQTDLYEDAWGFVPEFADVIKLLKQLKVAPEKRLTKRLIEQISKMN